MNNIKLTKLDNGLKVVTKKIESFESVALGYWIEAGGVCETSNNCGISHFLEHMAFKGTKKRSAKQIASDIESVGGFLNAYTSKEVTAYHAKLLKQDLHIATDVLSDILQNPTFSEEELERERGVILQEIHQTNDSPDDIIFDHMQNVAFQNQSLGYPILGPQEIVKTINADQLREYMKTHYHSDNIVFAAVGNINHDQLLEVTNDHFKSFNQSKNHIKYNKKFKYIGGAYSDIRDFEQVHTIIGFDGMDSTSADYYPTVILSSILGGGISSRLFQEIREIRGLAYSIYSFSSSYKYNGLFGIYAATTADKLAELSDVLAVEIQKVTENITDDEFNRTIAQFKASLLMSSENNSTSCERIVNQTMIFGHPISNQEMIEKLEEVTIDDVKRILKQFLKSKATVVTVGKCDHIKVTEQLQKNSINI